MDAFMEQKSPLYLGMNQQFYAESLPTLLQCPCPHIHANLFLLHATFAYSI
jgi:hypothetical protein